MAIYFASDFHLGLKTNIENRERESHIINWLDSIIQDSDALYLLGDTFDYWYEYKNVIPKGYTRFLAALTRFTDQGIPVHIFTGNHDMWMFGYLEEEIGAKVYTKPLDLELNGLKFKIGHGDGLGPGDKAYKLIKKVFSSPLNQWLFARLHPNTGIGFMKWMSRKSREKELEVIPFKGPEEEWLIQYAERCLQKSYYDYFIFGHRHLPIDQLLSNNKSRYINTGDWLHHYSYAKLENQQMELLSYDLH